MADGPFGFMRLLVQYSLRLPLLSQPLPTFFVLKNISFSYLTNYCFNEVTLSVGLTVGTDIKVDD